MKRAKVRHIRFFALLLLLFSTSSCAEFSLTKKFTSIDEEMRPYVDEFVMMSGGTVTQQDVKNLTTGFYEPNEDSNAIGLCNYLTYEISIKGSYWKAAGHLDRMEIMFHELGHCIKSRQHTAAKDSFWHDLLFDLGLFTQQENLRDGCPASLMHPYVVGWFCFNKHYNYYIDELFLRTNRQDYNAKPWETIDGNIQISR